MFRIKPEYKRILENIFSLSLLNGINYVFPIILIPYLTKVLGLQNYGKYAFSYSIILYFTLIVNYGFDLSATKRIAINKFDKTKIQNIFSAVIVARLLLALLSSVLLIIFTYLFSTNFYDYYLYLAGIGFILSSAIHPVWLYQGLEKMKYITLISFLSRASTLLLIILLVKSSEDYIYVNLYYAIGLLLASLISFLIATIQFKFKLFLPKWKDVKFEFIDGWQIFLSTIFMNFYRNSNIVILGAVSTYEVVALYAAGEKIIKAFQALVSPIAAALFPFFGGQFGSGLNKTGIVQFKRFAKIYFVLLLIISVFILFFSYPLINYYLPSEFAKAITNIKIMSFVIVFGGLNYFYGINGLINMGFQKQFTISVFIAGFFNLIICYFLSLYFRDIGASIAMLVTEILLFIFIYFYFIKFIKSKQYVSKSISYNSQLERH